MRTLLLILCIGCGSEADTVPDAAPATDRSDDGAEAIPGHAFAGINLPPTQGNSNAGAFMPGVYTWNYTDAEIAAASATFQTVRLPINEATANNPAALARLKSFVDRFASHRAIICMFGTTKPGTGTHGDGLPDAIQPMGAAWAKIHAVFGSYPNVKYEILNEPFGYAKSNPARYVNDMKAIIAAGGLPPSKCILDGMGFAQDIEIVAAAGWHGDLAYHFYPNWSRNHAESAYSYLVRTRVGSLGPRTWITEFGANLAYHNPCYQTPVHATQPTARDVNALRGLDDALSALRASGHGVKGTFVWHGWDNGDNFDFWKPANSNGACKVHLIQSHS
jgi:hypothetical protein